MDINQRWKSARAFVLCVCVCVRVRARVLVSFATAKWRIFSLHTHKHMRHRLLGVARLGGKDGLDVKRLAPVSVWVCGFGCGRACAFVWVRVWVSVDCCGRGRGWRTRSCSL